MFPKKGGFLFPPPPPPPATFPGGGCPCLCATFGSPIALTVAASFHNLFLREGVIGVQWGYFTNLCSYSSADIT